jgi:hypothetical protein
MNVSENCQSQINLLLIFQASRQCTAETSALKIHTNLQAGENPQTYYSTFGTRSQDISDKGIKMTIHSTYVRLGNRYDLNYFLFSAFPSILLLPRIAV